jgi:exodeoxyribonuclease VII large subunit
MHDLHHNTPEFTVSEISQTLKKTVESSFSHVRIRGEVSSFKLHTSGHAYFTLKDESAVLDAVCWKGNVGRLQIRPEEGMEVIATGKLTTYPGRSKYQVVVESMEIAGEGALLKMLEARKKQLAAEGLFDEERKKPLPFIPKSIGVVTSPTGAVIRDILHRIEDRFPNHVLVWPVLVQGDGAAEQIAAAIHGFNNLPSPPELLIVARGGGSLEDLWCFNEEIVVRAVADSTIPIISAVGHETDITLCDFAADQRAPTPTAAAEFAVSVRRDLAKHLQHHHSRIQDQLDNKLSLLETRVDALKRGIPDLDSLMGDWSQRLDDWSERLNMSWATVLKTRHDQVSMISSRLPHPRQTLEKWESALQGVCKRLAPMGMRSINDNQSQLQRWGPLLESYSYERTLERGFTLTLDSQGNVVTSANTVNARDTLNIRFKDGERKVEAKEKLATG